MAQVGVSRSLSLLLSQSGAIGSNVEPNLLSILLEVKLGKLWWFIVFLFFLDFQIVKQDPLVLNRTL